MKIAVIILACVVATSAQFNTGSYNTKPFDPFGYLNRNQYKPTPAPYRYRPTSITPSYYTASTPTPIPVRAVIPSIKITSDDSNAQILKNENEIYPDGSYAYAYDTSNGISAQEQGTPRDFGGNPRVAPDVATGSFSWTAPNGQLIQTSYIADENGYQATGNAIPTSPPIPPLIQRALEYLAKNGSKK